MTAERVRLVLTPSLRLNPGEPAPRQRVRLEPRDPMMPLANQVRRVLTAAYCYYGLDSPIMSDGDYDKLSREIAKRWGELEFDEQFKLGSAGELRASGSHFRYSRRDENGARSYWVSLNPRNKLPAKGFTKWWHSKEVEWQYATFGSFGLLED